MSIRGRRGLVRREIRSANDRLRGIVMSELRQTFFRPSQADAASWVCDVDVGSNRILKNVIVKIASGKDRGYAAVGRPVMLERNARGRWQIIGPSDRQIAQGSVTILDLSTETTTSATSGFTFRREPFEFYKGAAPTTFFDPDADSDTLVWIDFSDLASITESGGFISAATDKSGNGHHLASAGAGQDPAQVQNAGTNNLYAADFDGINDRLEFAVNISESVSGVVSFFIMVSKEVVGSGDDTILQTQRWEIRSRDSAWDRWTIQNGGSDVDSGSSLPATVALIEVVARAHNDYDLYQDGTFLLTSTAAAAGSNWISSQLGDHRSYVRYHPGVIAEVLVINRAVSDADRVDIESYFATKYNVAYSRWNDGSTPFPKTSIIDADGDIVG